MPRKQHLGQIGDYWLSQRKGSGAWCRTWFDKRTRQTKRESLGTEDFGLAQLGLAEWIVFHQVLKKESPQETLIQNVLLRYYEKHGKNIRSAKVARISLKKWSDYYDGQVVSEITLENANGFIKSLQAKGHSEGYIRRIIGVGKSALSKAYQRGEISAIPYIPSVSADAIRERILTLEETASLFNAVDSEHVFMYLMIAFNTAARPEAILELKRFQVNLESKFIQLNPTGRKQTKKRRPTLPITDALFPWLERANTDVLVNWHGKQIKEIRKAFTSTRERAGLDSSVIPYTIRHTIATELRGREVPEWECKGFMGHSSSGETERYAKFRPDYMSKARIAIDEYFIELQPLVNRTLIFNNKLRVNCVLAED